MYWNKDIECMDRGQLRELQGLKLQATAKKVYENVPFYKKAFDEKGVRPEDIKTVDDVKLLPFTLKSDLRDNYPFGLFAVPQSEICRVHASSGTTGKPTVVGYTARDISKLGGPDGAHVYVRGRNEGFRDPGGLRLRPVHRRTGRALRRGTPGRDDGAHLRRQYQASDHADAGFRHDHPCVHPVVRAVSRGDAGGDGRGP